MSRLARLVVPGFPHHVTQRGIGRRRVFFSNADYALYRDLLSESCRANGVACWARCLLPTRIHLILVPSDEDGLRRALAPVHRRYAGVIHEHRHGSGQFWHGRFGAAVMDEDHLIAALQYVLFNPLLKRLVSGRKHWRWSSLRCCLKGRDDGLTDTSSLLRRFPDLAKRLTGPPDAAVLARIRSAETIGRPLGSLAFVERLERRTGRKLKAEKRGPKPAED